MSFDIPNSPFGDRVRRRLETEPVGWLTTVDPDGTPRPSPVWFWWDGETILIYSKDGTARTRNLVTNPACSFNFNSDRHGADVVVLEGTAAMIDTPPSTEHPEYQEKYRKKIPGIGMTPATFAMAYPVPVRFTPLNLRGF